MKMTKSRFIVIADNLILLFSAILGIASLYFLFTAIPIFEPFTDIRKLNELLVQLIWFVAVIGAVILMISGASMQAFNSLRYEGPRISKLSSISNIATIVLGIAWLVLLIVIGDIYGKDSPEFNEVSIKIISAFIPRIFVAYLHWSYAFGDSKTKKI